MPNKPKAWKSDYTYDGKAAYFCKAIIDGWCTTCGVAIKAEADIVYVARARTGKRVHHIKCVQDQLKKIVRKNESTTLL